MASRRDAYISKTLKCFIFLNLLKKKKKDAKCNNFQRKLKKNFKEILVLKILRLLIALKHSFKSFKGQKALFKPFNVFLMKGGKKKAFFTRGNSSCHAHIHQHYDIYKEQCKQGNIPENHHALPQQIYRQMKADKKVTGAAQQTLDGVLEKLQDMKTYTHDGATYAIAQFVVCN